MKTFAERLAANEAAPYVYVYPPTRSYVPVEGFDPSHVQFTQQLNLYVHVPFCRQKCTFCGYLVAVESSEPMLDGYIIALRSELNRYRQVLQGKEIVSINLGGGTPSLLSPKHIERLLATVTELFPNWPTTSREVSIEATPESLSLMQLLQYRALGVNRVSIGIQSFAAEEIASVKRHNLPDRSRQAIWHVREAQIPNLCCDLMYGLPGQTVTSWQMSVEALLKERPETIELYATVTIPGTGLAQQAATTMSPAERLKCYEIARDLCLAAGYEQEAHLRFVLPKVSGYLQQQNVFAGQSLIGIGASARSYGINAHYRNAPVGRGLLAVRTYILQMGLNEWAVNEMVALSHEEQARRALIYRLDRFCPNGFRREFGDEVWRLLSPTLTEFLLLGLLEMDGRLLKISEEGLAHRDLMATELFSPAVREREEVYYAPTIPVEQLVRR